MFGFKNCSLHCSLKFKIRIEFPTISEMELNALCHFSLCTYAKNISAFVIIDSKYT